METPQVFEDDMTFANCLGGSCAPYQHMQHNAIELSVESCGRKGSERMRLHVRWQRTVEDLRSAKQKAVLRSNEQLVTSKRLCKVVWRHKTHGASR